MSTPSRPSRVKRAKPRKRLDKLHADRDYYPRCRRSLGRRGIEVRIADRVLESSELQDFRAVGIDHHHPRRVLYCPHLTELPWVQRARSVVLRVFLGFNVSAIGAVSVFAT